MAKFINRFSYIGASDFPVVMEKSKWKKRITLVLEKAQVIPIEDVNNTALDRGTRLEPIVIDEFEKQTGFKVCNFQKEVVREKTDTCIKLLAHLDGEIQKTNIPLEAKTTNIKNKWSEIPDYYIPQLEFQMFLNKSTISYIAVGYVKTDDDVDICDFDFYKYEKNMTDEEIIAICEEFTAEVEKHKSLGVINTGEIVKAEIDSSIIDELDSLENKIKAVKSQINPLEKRKKELETILKTQIANNAGIENDLYKITLGQRISEPSTELKISRSNLKIEYKS